MEKELQKSILINTIYFYLLMLVINAVLISLSIHGAIGWIVFVLMINDVISVLLSYKKSCDQ